MDTPSAVARFSALGADEQLRFLAKFGHNLTLVARDTYVPGSDRVHAPERLRRLNETQHRVFGHLLALLSASKWRYPDDAIVSIMLEHDDDYLRSQVAWAFEDALKYATAV